MGKTYRKGSGKLDRGKIVRSVSRELFKDMPLGKVYEDKDKSKKYPQDWRDLIEEENEFLDEEDE